MTKNGRVTELTDSHFLDSDSSPAVRTRRVTDKKFTSGRHVTNVITFLRYLRRSFNYFWNHEFQPQNFQSSDRAKKLAFHSKRGL